MDLQYTQQQGFSEYKGTLLHQIPELREITGYKDQIEAAGYVQQWEYTYECSDDEFVGYEQEGENRYGLPRFLVTYWDVSRGDHIYCNDPGDFFALRLKLTQSHWVAPQIAALYEMARKAFQALHGHDELDSCRRCAPLEHRQR